MLSPILFMEGNRMIKIKLFEADEILKAIEPVMAQQISGKTAYDLARIVDTLASEASAYTKARMKLLEQYANKDENGKPIQNNGHFDISDRDAFMAELEPIAYQECVIDRKPIKLSALESVSITPDDMRFLKLIIEED